jgi:hypothetical protein
MCGYRIGIRSCLAVLVLIIPLFLPIVPATGANQTDLPINDRANFQIAACRAAGGIDEVITDRTPAGGLTSVVVICKGGLLDGMNCWNTPGYIDCTFPFRPQEQPIDVPPTGGIAVEAQPPLETLVETVDVTVAPVLAEDVSQVESVVMPVRGGDIEGPALAQVNGCRILGGEAQVDVELARDGAPEEATVLCVGGVANGLWCHNETWGSLCTMLPLAERAGGETAVPATAGPEVASESPTATMTPEPTVTTAPGSTATSTSMPTPTPTTAPTATPTATPTQQTGPPPPKVDNSVPPGPAEDPSNPTPTMVPLV